MNHSILFFILFVSFPFTTFGQILNPTNQDSIDIYATPFIPARLKSSGELLLTQNVFSTDGSIQLTVTIHSGAINYSIHKNLVEIIAPSLLDIQLSDGMLVQGVSVVDLKTKSLDEIIQLPYGERPFVNNKYNEITFNLLNNKGLKFSLIFRVYNEGVGFRYLFPDNNIASNIRVNNEFTQFILADVHAAYKEPYNEQGYTPSAINGLKSLIPLTITGKNFSVCINEAGNDQFARIALQGVGNTLQTYFVGTPSPHLLPVEFPWRYIVIAESTNLLVENKEMLYALNAQPFNTSEWEWVKPGKVFRCMNLSTDSALESIDFCVDMNIDYMMFDAGWYGLGYGQSKEKDPASNPLAVIEGLDMDAVTNYATIKGIGVILYINKVAWCNYDNQAMFDLYESWGIKGLKLGFVDGYSAYGNQKVYGIIQEAANRKMFVNVHDNFRPTGLVQKFPNLLTAEGVRGNEAIANTGDHNSLIPYTRMLTGATDFTICYLGNDPEYKRPSSLATTRAHQLAMSVMMYSPLQHVFWYAIPEIYHNPVEVELFTILPVVWDDFKLVAGDMGKYVSMARRSGDDWYLTTMNNSAARDLRISLDFLESELNYEVIIYKDANPATIGKVETTLQELTSNGALLNNELFTSLKSNGGEVVVFRPLSNSTLSKTTTTRSKIKLYPNPASHTLNIDLGSYGSSTVKIWSLIGGKVYERRFISPLDTEKINTSHLANGVYIVVVETEHEKFTEFIVVE